MKTKNLDELRLLYGQEKDTIQTPIFKKIASKVFANGNRQFPYAGIPTLLNAPYLPFDSESDSLNQLQAALYGMPMDLGVSNRSGARFGPRSLRSIERIGPYNHVLECAPVYEIAVADIGDVPFNSRFRLEKSHENIQKFVSELLKHNIIPVGVGGDHSVTFPVLQALGATQAVGLIHFDAHCDTGGPFDQTKFHHGGPFRNAVLAGVLDPKRTIQIGIRGSSEYLWEFSYQSGMTVIHAEDIPKLGIDNIIKQARDIVGNGPTYLSFDVDCLDPAFAPGTGTPEIGGLTTREALALLRGLKGLNFIGGDVVEVAPQYDSTTNTAQAGAQILFEILSLIQFSPALKNKA
ncbi:agmatinase [Snodgrassella sp. CFCC 13594]|uniref:agmatinase n=1 Tax=Snodgrassella sp. CFCC 13594 TaxID=1775559 RepID=UPI00082F2617|nr:agmatinase [Snodgrassella sp. CFCC 13594]